ncbi:MAG TPA: type II toxin-antitoxin system VapC family toxin [Patescibacteria group bacterium]|nr:type II toxin-antitoxin system VapC family toxin [Patescibacteria group bacterium]
MAKIFLDTNYFIDSVHRKPEEEILESLENNIIYISPLSIHIYCYVFKIKIPDSRVVAQKEKFQIVEFSEDLLDRSLQGPTNDFEDNVQLHSAAEAECDIFLTEDKKLLDMKFFGKVKLNRN